MDKLIRQRLKWIELYQETKNVGLVCRRCGISRPTLLKWLRRYEELGIEGLRDESRRPHSSPARKVNASEEKLILKMRRERGLGARRLKNELYRKYSISLS